MNWTIIYYYHKEPIHLKHLYSSNPLAQIIPIYLKADLPKNEAWKNSDRILRQIIKDNDIINQIIYNNILLLEWDVYLNIPVPDLQFESYMAKYILSTPNNWCWWPEVKNMPQEFQEYAIGSPMFGVIAVKKYVLQELLNDKYNTFFNLNIISELRTPTIIKSLGYTPSPFPDYFSQSIFDGPEHNLSTHNLTTHRYGIFHPIKHRLCL